MANNWEKNIIFNDLNQEVEAQSPVIVSASRATDIPAFYADWLVDRLNKGYVKWVNPFNRSNPYYISFNKLRLLVFWTKNPEPILSLLNDIDRMNINYYFQFTLNDYDKENFEPNVPKLEKRIDTFKELSDKIGKEKVIWRFDPIILTDEIDTDEIITRISELAYQLSNFTNKLVFSFVDIANYKAVKQNLSKYCKNRNLNSNYFKGFDNDSKLEIAEKLSKILFEIRKINQDFEIATCAEDIELDRFGIKHNKCIDDELIIKCFSNDNQLMDFIGYSENDELFGDRPHKVRLKDKGQRKQCGCIFSKDIGAYNTCKHLCIYCYANSSVKMVETNFKKFDKNGDNI